MKQSTLGCMKFARLQAALGTPHRGDVTGILEMLWQFAGANAITGAVGKFRDEEIAAWMGCRLFDRTPSEMMELLVECGFLDAHPVHRLVVHDWHDHCASFVKGNLARYGGKFANLPDDDPRQPNPVRSRAPAIATAQEAAKAHAKAPARERATIPNQAIPSLPPPTPTAPVLGGGGGSKVLWSPEWGKVAADLKSLGVTTAEATVSACLARGCPLEWAKAVIEHFRSKPGAWNPGFLGWRLREGELTVSPNDAWPALSESYQAARASQAKAAEQRVRAEDGALYEAIKVGRRAGKSDETIRDELLAKGLKAALIRFNWLDQDGNPFPPKPHVAPPAAPPPPVEPAGDNPF